jgi:hypothetical protein
LPPWLASSHHSHPCSFDRGRENQPDSCDEDHRREACTKLPDGKAGRDVWDRTVSPCTHGIRIQNRSADTTPLDVQARSLEIATCYAPHVELEELDRDEPVVRIVVTPLRPSDGSKLASEVLAAVRNTNGARAAAA